jgi:hypothetical protein
MGALVVAFFYATSACAHVTDGVPRGTPLELRVGGSSSADEAAAPTLRSRVESLKVDQHIKVVRARGGEIKGTFIALAGDSMSVLVKEQKDYVGQTVALSDVESLWNRGNHAELGGIVGLAVGFGIGALLVANRDCTSDGGTLTEQLEEEAECEVDSIAYFLVGGLIGGLAGYLVGHNIHWYEQVYPAEN